jgi:S1-C subfamily serine protease
MVAAVVRLEFSRAPEAEVAAAGTAAPRAATVSQQDAAASPSAVRPDTDVTGLLVEPRGTVLTSALNLNGLQGPVTVLLADGRRYRAKPRGRHVDMDVAVLKVEGLKASDPWPMAKLEPTAVPRVGSLIGVLGAPLRTSEEPTFTTGIVSAVNRFDGLAAQTDAKTNFGNAGGPVTDLQGHCLGIITQVGPRKCWGQSSGVGFFAPVEKILSVLEDLRDGKTLRCPPQAFLGIAPAIGENDREGVKVGTVAENSPAWHAGLHEGDLITAAGGQITRSWSGLVSTLKSRRPGDELRLQVLRGHEVVVVPVVLSGKE